jgi:hypothetical protein
MSSYSLKQEDQSLISKIAKERLRYKACFDRNRDAITALIKDSRWRNEYSDSSLIIERLDARGDVLDTHSFPL